MNRRIRIILAVALSATMLFAGCGRSHSTRSETEVRSHNGEIAIETAAGAAEYYEEGFSTAGAGDYYNEDASDLSVSTAAPADVTSTAPVETPAVSDRMLIRNVNICCETLNFTELTTDLEEQVARLGGYIESKNFYGTGNSGDLRSVTYTIRVSSESLDQLINSIGTAAVITSTNESTEDVTLTYADTQARIESLRVEQETLNNLLAQADSLDIVLQLQNELTYVRYQIESYESQLRVLENLSSFSTLTLSISEVIEETQVEEPRVKTYSEKFNEAFQDGLDRFKNSMQNLGLSFAENVIPLSVTLLLLIIAAVVIIIIVKKSKKKAKAKAAAKKDQTPKPVS